MSLKKTLRASEQEGLDIAQAREAWAELQKTPDPNRLVFLDESGVKTNMTRWYGRALKGARCHDAAPHGHWEAVTVLSSIRLDGTTECIVFAGAVERKMFDAYVRSMPWLRESGKPWTAFLQTMPRAGSDLVAIYNLKVETLQYGRRIVSVSSGRDVWAQSSLIAKSRKSG